MQAFYHLTLISEGLEVGKASSGTASEKKMFLTRKRFKSDSSTTAKDKALSLQVLP